MIHPKDMDCRLKLMDFCNREYKEEFDFIRISLKEEPLTRGFSFKENDVEVLFLSVGEIKSLPSQIRKDFENFKKDSSDIVFYSLLARGNMLLNHLDTF